MRNLISNFLFLFISIPAFGTSQIFDILIYKGDTLYLAGCPLDYFPDQGLINVKRLFGGSGCFFTACYRNYVATWTIEGNKLYLLGIRNACYPTSLENVSISYKKDADTIGKEFADLETLFPGRFANGKVSAYWVSAKMISPKGKMLYLINDGFMSIYEKESEFTFEKGTLVQIREYDNSRTSVSKYTKDPELIKEFVQKNIDYSRLPAIEKSIKVIVAVLRSNEDGKIDSVRIIRGFNDAFDKEAERVVRSIPQWDILYRHGKKIDGAVWTIPVIFEAGIKN